MFENDDNDEDDVGAFNDSMSGMRGVSIFVYD
jgi:hypothetical protein